MYLKPTICIILLTCMKITSAHHKQKRLVTPFPHERSLYGTFIAIAVPVDLPEQNVFVSYNFEVNHYLPYNTTELGDLSSFAPIATETQRMARSISRKLVYQILEDDFKKKGFPGEDCLLRNICEAAEYPLDHNGVLGGIMHIIFTPSSSEDEALPESFYRAEKLGRERKCESFIEKCTFSLFDFITKTMNII